MIEKIVSKYLCNLDIPIAKKYCEKLILSHPKYPSFLSISDALKILGISHQVVKIKKENICDLTFPYLLQPIPLNGKDGIMKLINSRNDFNKVKERYESAIVVKAKGVKQIADRKNKEQHSNDKLLRTLSYSLILTLFLTFVLLAIWSFSLLNILLLFTALGGATIGYLIAAKDIGVQNHRIDKFCTAGKKSHCTAVLNSAYAKLIDGINISDLTLSYFIFQVFVIGFFVPLSGFETTFMRFLSILSLLTIPLISYTLYIQYYKTKKWCRLCLIIDFIIISQIYLFYNFQYYGYTFSELNPLLIAVSVLFFFSVLSLSVLIKKTIKKGKKYDSIKISFDRFRNSPIIFVNLLKQNKKNKVYTFDEEITIGNPDAGINIIQISNPYCEPCKIEHENLSQLLNMYPNEVSITFRFLRDNINNKIRDKLTIQYLLQYWMQNVKDQKDISKFNYNLLEEWYDIGNLKKFKDKYPLKDSYKPRSANLEENHNKWVNQIGITKTPTFLINGYKVHQSYGIRDFLFLMPELIHSKEIKI